MDADDSIPVHMAKQAYVEDRITLEEFESALADRLTGNSYRHVECIDGYIPSSVRTTTERDRDD